MDESTLRRSSVFVVGTVLVVVALLAAGPSRAQKPNPLQIVLSKMHALNQMEMQVGQMAWAQGGTELVSNYGERLFRDHRSADDKVTTIAEGLGVQLIPLPKLAGSQKKMRQMRKMMKKLKQQQGEQFTAMFLKMMVQSHNVAIQTLDQALTKLQNEEVQTLIRRLLPILKQHRALAQQLQG